MKFNPEDFWGTKREIKVGDRVRVTKKAFIDGRPYWVSEMDKTIGETGVVKDIDYSRNIDKGTKTTIYQVYFDKLDTYWHYCIDSLELVG